MVARSGGYCGVTFKGSLVVTQGDPLSPTIFNVVVNVVLSHWVTVMVGGTEEWGELGKEVRHNNALFYADDGMVASSDPHWIQGGFSTLVGLFGRVGLRTTFGKKVGMVFPPCQVAGTQLEASYGRLMTGKGPSNRERQK